MTYELPMTVPVTDEDIKKGNHSATSCPVALAVKRAADAPWVSVFEYAILPKIEFQLPRDVVKRIKDYDAGYAMEPFTFMLDESHVTYQETDE